MTNGIPEIIVKIGEWGGVEHRKELSVFTKIGDFDTLVEIFGELGFCPKYIRTSFNTRRQCSNFVKSELGV